MSEPINGIKATLFHDEGAIAQCGYCQRYTLDRRALSDRPPTCDCGKQNGWSGSFKKPTPESIWFGDNPPPQPDTIQVSRAEYEALKRDAKRWRAFNQRMARRLSPTNTAWKLVEVCPMYGEEKEIRDWREQIEAAINMPANVKGGE